MGALLDRSKNLWKRTTSPPRTPHRGQTQLATHEIEGIKQWQLKDNTMYP